MNRIFVDFEMNVVPRQLRQSAGLRQEIIEIGAVRMDGDYQVTDTFRAYIHPQYSDFVDSKIYRLTGITSRDVAARPLLQQGLTDFAAWCGDGFTRMYAWSESDLAQLEEECAAKGLDDCGLLQRGRVHWVDFQRIYCRVLHERRQVSLEYALKNCGIAPDGTLHDAADDARNSARIMAYFHSPAFEKHLSAVAAVHQKEPSHMNALSGALQQQLAALLAEMQEEDGD